MRQTVVVGIGLLVALAILAARTDLIPDDLEWLAVVAIIVSGVVIAVASRFRGL
jgi:hypothetical protein